MVRCDEEATERGAVAGTSGRSRSISAALPFALRRSDCSAAAGERCQQRLRPSGDPAGGNPLSAKLLEPVKLGWKSLKRLLINVNSIFCSKVKLWFIFTSP